MRVDTCTHSIEVQLTNGNAHSPGSKITKAKDSAPIRENDAVAKEVSAGILCELSFGILFQHILELATVSDAEVASTESPPPAFHPTPEKKKKSSKTKSFQDKKKDEESKKKKKKTKKKSKISKKRSSSLKKLKQPGEGTSVPHTPLPRIAQSEEGSTTSSSSLHSIASHDPSNRLSTEADNPRRQVRTGSKKTRNTFLVLTDPSRVLDEPDRTIDEQESLETISLESIDALDLVEDAKPKCSVAFADYSEMIIVADLSLSSDFYYSDHELAEFRHDAFLESCGLTGAEFRDC